MAVVVVVVELVVVVVVVVVVVKATQDAFQHKPGELGKGVAVAEVLHTRPLVHCIIALH